MLISVQGLKRSIATLVGLCSFGIAHAEIYSSPELQTGKQYLAGEIDPDENRGAWVMAHAHRTKQKAQDFTPGYRSHTFGGGFGVDVRPFDPVLVGIGFRFDYTDQDSLNYSGTDMDFSSTRLMAYGRYDINDRWFVNALFAYAFNEYNTHRFVHTFLAPTFAANVVEAIGDIDGRQFTAELDSGYQFSYDKWQLLPIASLSFNRLHLDPYNELSAGLAGRQFAKRNLDSVKASLDLILAYQNEFPLAQLMPYIHFKVIYDTETDLEFGSDVFGGGTAFATFGPTPPHSSYQTGAGFTLFGQRSVQVSMRYDFSFKHRYRDHSGVLYIRHEW